MSRLSLSNARIIPEMITTVYLGGKVRRDVECESVNVTWGASPSSASLYIPRWYIEDEIGELDDLEVVVYARTGNAVSNLPIFRGYLAMETRRETAYNTLVGVTAFSMLGWLDRLYVGQALGVGVVKYLREDAAGTDTSWRISTIIRDLFSEDNLPTQWAAKVALGRTSAIERIENDIYVPDITFTSTNYRDAIRYLLGLAGKLGLSERFAASKTYLDFYRVNDSSLPAREIKACDESTGPAQGAYLLDLSWKKDSSRVRTRVIGYGRPTEIMVTVSSDPDWQGSPLIPDWENATNYENLEGASVLTADEQAVVDMPGLATPGTPAYQEKYGAIFRRFRLPECLREHSPLDRNVLRLNDSGNVSADGKIQETQFWREEFTYAYNEETKTYVGTGQGSGGTLMKGGQFLPGGRVLFPEPVLANISTNLETGAVTYRRCHAFITYSFAHASKTITHDTGTAGLEGFPDLSPPGMVFEFTNPNLTEQRIGTETGEVINASGTGFTFKAKYYNPVSEQWQTTTAGVPVAIVDDAAFLADLAESALQERNHRATQASLRLPGVWNSFRAGEVLSITGRGIDSLRLQITGVSFDLRGSNTTIQCTNGVPETVNLKSRRDERAGGQSGVAKTGGPGRVKEAFDPGAVVGGHDFNNTFKQFRFRPEDQPVPGGLPLSTAAGAQAAFAMGRLPSPTTGAVGRAFAKAGAGLPVSKTIPVSAMR